MEYQSQSFLSSDRTKATDTPSKYTVKLDRDIKRVKEIRLGTIELPRTQYIVEEGFNTLTFSEGFKLGANGISFTKNGTQTDIFVPNYINSIQDVTTTGQVGDLTTYRITTPLPWDVEKYFEWKKTREAEGHVVPDLVLLGADTSTSDVPRPFVVLNKENFIPISNDPPTFDIQNNNARHTRFNITSTALYLHRAPWHIPELLSFLNHCAGYSTIEYTDEGKFKSNVESVDYPASDTAYADGVSIGLFHMDQLPFKFVGNNSSTVAPKMRATLPVGDYTASDVATLLPQFMSLGYLSKDTTFQVLIGLVSFSVPIQKGTYSTPFLFNEAIRIGLQTTFESRVLAIDCAYEGVGAEVIFSENEFQLGEFRFFGVSNATQTTYDFPFMLDFSQSSLEFIHALNVDAIQYGPATSIASNSNVRWPNLLGVEFNKYTYEISSTVPATQKFCIKAFNPSIDPFHARITVTNNCMMFMDDMSLVLPYQTNDICYLRNNTEWTTTARVLGAGYATLLYVTPAEALQLVVGDTVVQTIPVGLPGAGRQVVGIVKSIAISDVLPRLETGTGDGIDDGVLEVFSLFTTDSDQFTSGVPITNLRDQNQYTPYTCTLCKRLGLVLNVGCHVPTMTDSDTIGLTTGFIDPPRFEIENPYKQFNEQSDGRTGIQDSPSLAQRLGIPRTRLSGRNFYLFDNQFNFDPIPYILLYVKVSGGTAPAEKHRHQFFKNSAGTLPSGPLAKLIMQTPFTINRNQIMELSFNSERTIRELDIEFRNPDGSLVNFHGREHSMTIGFVCAAAGT